MGGEILDVSVVICAYTERRWDDLRRAVDSVLGQRRPVREVLVVVDHNPRLLELARWCWPSRPGHRRAEPPVVVVPNAEQRGLSGARNTGVAHSRGEIVAFLDDDAEAVPDWIERLVAPYTDPEVVASGGSAQPLLDVPRPTWWPVEFDWVIGCSYAGLPEQTATVRNVIGCNMSVRRPALEAVGGFAHGLGRVGRRPVGCEETDLCIRLRQHWPGAKIVYEPAAAVCHRVPEDRLRWSYFRARCYAEGLSKAHMAGRVGSERALASERQYVTRVLPSALLRALRAGRARRVRPGRRAGGRACDHVRWLRGGASGLAPRGRPPGPEHCLGSSSPGYVHGSRGSGRGEP